VPDYRQEGELWDTTTVGSRFSWCLGVYLHPHIYFIFVLF